MMNNYKSIDHINHDEVMQRLDALPESYIVAIEKIIDQLDKDWQNRIIYNKYISLLCDMFEEAIANNQVVEDVCGDDIIAFAIKFQAEHDFRELEPTDFTKTTNYILIYNLILIFSIISLVAPIAQIMKEGTLSLESIIFLVIGGIVAAISLLLKSNLFKKRNINVSNLSVSLIIGVIVMVVSLYNQQGSMNALIGVAAICIYDLNLISKKLKKRKE